MSFRRLRPRGPFRSRLTYRSAAAAAAAVVAISALAACGTLNWEWQLPTSWDPVTSSAGWDMHVLGLGYASLTTRRAGVRRRHRRRGDCSVGHPSQWRRFREEVIPILKERGVVRTEYESATLRGNLGLPVPENRYSMSRKEVLSRT